MQEQQWSFFYQTVPLGMRVAQVVGITSAAYLAGKCPSAS
jgi:hypothetical protein